MNIKSISLVTSFVAASVLIMVGLINVAPQAIEAYESQASAQVENPYYGPAF